MFLLATFCITACKKNNGINQKQAVLFQFEYVNYAWGFQHSGFLIDNKGNVLTYTNPQNWNFPDKDLILNESQIRSNMSNCLNSGIKIPPQELTKYAGFIKNISQSKVTALKNVAADEGSMQYICYQYYENSGTYRGVLVKMEGDFTCENLNFYSKKVTLWMKKINDSLTKK
jgi:hypothetical protein